MEKLKTKTTQVPTEGIHLITLKCPNCLEQALPTNDPVISKTKFYEVNNTLWMACRATIYCTVCDSNMYEGKITVRLKESNLIN